MNSPGFTTSSRLQSALGKPLSQRCSDIRALLEDSCHREIHLVMPTLVESIMGFGPQAGWNLDRLCRSNQPEFRGVHELLRTGGPLFKIIDKLVQDPSLRYEFPLTCLPYNTQRALEEGILFPLYTDKLQLSQSGQPPPRLSLNAFEYYIFHFAFFLVNPRNAKMTSWSNPSDALYPILVEDYLNYLMPLDTQKMSTTPGRGKDTRSVDHRSPAPNTVWSPLPSPYQSPSLRHSLSAAGHHGNNSPFRLLGPQADLHSSPRSPAPAAATSSSGGEMDVWRAQCFLQILVEFWLNHVSTSDMKSSFSTLSGQYWSSPVRDPYNNWPWTSCLPSADHVRILRMLVKHIHYFSNSSVSEHHLSSVYTTSQPASVPWTLLKRQALGQFMQKPLYLFFKETFHRWPLDASFRQVLETWLSFIQPWRYLDASLSNRERVEDVKDRLVDEKWRGFVADHLLFYTALLESFLFRALRMDLKSPRNAYMVFRVAKVFCVSGLQDMMEEAERSLYESPSQQSHNALHHDLSSSFSSPGYHHLGSHHHGNLGAMVGMQIAELESPSYRYHPLFSEETIVMVEQLLMLISQAKESASQIVHTSVSDSFSWLGLFGIGGQDYNTSQYYGSDRTDDLSYGDLKKIHTHLDQAANNFCQFFHVSGIDKVDKTVSWGDTQTESTSPKKDGQSADTLTPDVYDTEDGPKLSPLGRYQVMNGLRKFDIGYHGDPELQPIRSFESAVLVRILYAVSCFLNQQFSTHFDHYYFRDDFPGKLSRQILWGPAWAVETSSSPPRLAGNCPTTSQNQPRLSLRWLANTKLLAYLGLVYIVLRLWWGLGVMEYMFCFVAVIFFVCIVRVFTHPVKFRSL